MTSGSSPLQREIRQKRPFQSRTQETLLGLLRTVDQIRHRLAEVAEPRGITLQQYNVLRILRGSASEGLPTLEIAERMIERAPGITRLMDRLEAKGYVRRVRCPHDRRQVLCWITDDGAALLKELDVPMSEAAEGCLGVLNENDKARLDRSLTRVREQLKAHPEPSTTETPGRAGSPVRIQRRRTK